MLDYLNNKEMILVKLKNGLTSKGYSFKIIAGINGQLESLLDIKKRYSFEILKSLIENTNYSILEKIDDVKHGLDNVSYINKRKSDWYLYVINKNDITEKNNEVLRESFLSNETLIYETERGISGKYIKFYCIFNKKKYEGKQEYIANRWQER